MKNILLILTVCLAFVIQAQQVPDLKNLLPDDPRVSRGVLENGLTYYVRSNGMPKNRADMYLVVKAGSIDEDDDQKGIAHFCEHMSFNGTKNFPKHELIDYLETIGMEFGPEINAYTSFDETVYMIKVPLDSLEYIEKGLQVLYDWACQVTDSDEEIEKERGVIYEEWRGGRDAEFRMMQKWLPVFLKDSKYAERLPIGEMEIINTFAPETLRRFRKDWYRPDQEAVIVVGDFDREEMVDKIKTKFSTIPVPENPRKKENFDIPDHKETFISIVTDKEAMYPIANVYYKHPLEKAKTLADYRKMIVEGLYNSMINKRLAEKTQLPEPPFIFGQSAYTELVGPKSVYLSMAVTQNGKIGEGLKTVLIENERVRKFGFTQTELDRQKTAMLSSLEKAYNERENQQSNSYAEEYKRNFLITQEPFPGIENEFGYYKTFLPGITLEEVNSLAHDWITEENRVVVITAPEMAGTVIPTDSEVLTWLDEVKKVEIEPYDDGTTNLKLISKEPVSGKVISEKKIENVGAVEWKLSNGAKVVCKSTDFKDDEILFYAWSPGGNSLYDQKDDVSALLTTDVLMESGIAEFDKITLGKMLAGKVFGISPFLSEIREGFSGNSSVKDAETMLQMLYLYFTSPRFDDNSFKSIINRYSAILENKKASPEAAFQDTVSVVLSNYSPRKKPMTAELLKEADFSRIKTIGGDRFSNGSDYYFFFTGNIDPDSFKPLIEKYIGGIPSASQKENWLDLKIDPPAGVVEKFVEKGMDPKSIQYIIFHGKFDFNSKNVIEIDALGRILTTRLLEVIREDKSSVYYIGAQPSTAKYPESEYSFTFYYGTDPEKLSELKQAVFDEINNIIKNGPTDEDLVKVKEKLLREREVSLRENKFWLNLLSNTYFLKDGDFSEFGKFSELVNNLSRDSIKKAAGTYLDFNNYISVALKPEKK